jgi:hypothetical protein
MPISKRVRDEAAMLCALMASSNAEPCNVLGVDPFLGASANLAREAYWATPRQSPRRAEWAEAEAMLRTGWSP